MSLLQWNKSPLPQVSWDRRFVECISDFCHHFILQLLVVLQQVPIETIGTQSFVEVAALHCFNNFFSCEWSDTITTSVDLHLFITTNIEVNLTVVLDGHSISRFARKRSMMMAHTRHTPG
jgi:hypothetical protein